MSKPNVFGIYQHHFCLAIIPPMANINSTYKLRHSKSPSCAFSGNPCVRLPKFGKSKGFSPETSMQNTWCLLLSAPDIDERGVWIWLVCPGRNPQVSIANIYIFNRSICHCYLSLPECSQYENITTKMYTFRILWVSLTSFHQLIGIHFNEDVFTGFTRNVAHLVRSPLKHPAAQPGPSVGVPNRKIP